MLKPSRARLLPVLLLLPLLPLLEGCSETSGGTRDQSLAAESCMTCHNGSGHDDYSGPGIENPHPFGAAANLKCSTCHGGNPAAREAHVAHVPPPPEIGDREQWIEDPRAYFNRLTLTGIDKFPDYMVAGKSYTAIDYLQFINPGDLRVVEHGRSCGQCHQPHVSSVMKSLLATEGGVLSGAMYAIGVDNDIPAHQGLYEDTAADKAFRAVHNPSFSFEPTNVGAVGQLLEFPVYSAFDDDSPTGLRNNDLYEAAGLADDFHADRRVISNSPLANLYHEQIAFTCGDCHLGSAGANNRFGDFRSSGCTSCHMQYSLDGRSRTGDPNVNRLEPVDPDDIDEPELPHPARHLIRSVAKTLPSGEHVAGIDDYSCAGCHQGSNRTVMQYWGIRLDQNQDLRRRVQYPANPIEFRTTSGDERLFNAEINNRTFNGRNRNQYILFEDYDGDGRDDTPPDVHYEAGMGCIDCHGSVDLHGGNVHAPDGTDIHSRMEQTVAIRCESCHGSAQEYAPTVPGVDANGQAVEHAVDGKGNPLTHVTRDAAGNYFLVSKLTGNRHYVSQTRDVVVDSGKVNPFTGEPVYTFAGSYAMGRADGDPSTGIGPMQNGCLANGFAHGDSLSCVACHASWTNNCIGCHLEGEYSTNRNNFSNITGERIVFRERNADFVYQSPVFFQLGVDTKNRISPITPNTETFFKYRDRRGNFSDVFSFSDRNGGGSNPDRAAFPSLNHNVMMPHSIRGRVDDQNEGPRSCVACHLTDQGVASYRQEYDAFRDALTTGNFANLDFDLLQTHIGLNPGNQLNSPFFVHMAAGLGTGLFLFDADGAPVNPLDGDDDRHGCDGVAPRDKFDLGRVTLDLDRIVDQNGVATGSNNHPMEGGISASRRDGAQNANLSGPLGGSIVRRLTDPDTGIILDSWFDADGVGYGKADTGPLPARSSGSTPRDNPEPTPGPGEEEKKLEATPVTRRRR